MRVSFLTQYEGDTWYIRSRCDSNMLSYGTRVHAVTAICCHMSICRQVLTEWSHVSRLMANSAEISASVLYN